jgi:hypothetical protein
MVDADDACLSADEGLEHGAALAYGRPSAEGTIPVTSGRRRPGDRPYDWC